MKKLLILILFTTATFSSQAKEKNDCSIFKKTSKEYWACKKNNLSKGLKNSGKNFWKSTKEFQKESWKKNN
tara:strand:+ start:285 stop:497 length:213 start_codon:yes stop_codon:yes gene_type:complete